MRRYWLILIMSLSIILQGCKKCGHITTHEMLPLLQTYFGVYKPTHYWVYWNSDSTLKDSMYISDYSTYFSMDRVNNCDNAPHVHFLLKTSYFTEYSFLTVEYGTDKVEETLKGHLEISDNRSSREIGIRVDTTFSVSSSSKLTFIDSLTIYGNSYKNVIEYQQVGNGAVVFAPNIGIIKYISQRGPGYLQIDTFYLHHYFIQ